MPRPPSRSFLSRVRDALPDMHPTERRLGEFLCDFPGELASYTASELARLANVSNATVSRFIKRLGYKNYDDARRQVRAEKQSGSRLFLAAAGDSGSDHSLDAHIEQARENLSRTFGAIASTEIDDVARAMLDARKVWVIGFRTSHSFASYLQWQATQVIENIVAIPGAGETLGEHLVSLGDKDCVIVFGLRRRVAGMKAILREIEKSGAQFAYVTDEGVPRYKPANWHFRCQTMAPGPLFSHVAVMALCHALASRAIELAGAAGRRRLTAIEVINDALGEL